MDAEKRPRDGLRTLRAVYPIFCWVNAVVWVLLAVKEPSVSHVICAAAWTVTAVVWCFALHKDLKERKNRQDDPASGNNKLL